MIRDDTPEIGRLELSEHEAEWLMDVLHMMWATLTVQRAVALSSRKARGPNPVAAIDAHLATEKGLRDRLSALVREAREEHV